VVLNRADTSVEAVARKSFGLDVALGLDGMLRPGSSSGRRRSSVWKRG
jgi:hypothetical protein